MADFTFVSPTYITVDMLQEFVTGFPGGQWEFPLPTIGDSKDLVMIEPEISVDGRYKDERIDETNDWYVQNLGARPNLYEGEDFETLKRAFGRAPVSIIWIGLSSDSDGLSGGLLQKVAAAMKEAWGGGLEEELLPHRSR